MPVKAVTSSTSADLALEVVITGSYDLQLTTPTGLLSAGITAGDDEKVELSVKNTGSSTLKGVELTASMPVNWQVTFEPKTIDQLEPGQTASVMATIEADKNAIAGAYVTTFRARAPEATRSEERRLGKE